VPLSTAGVYPPSTLETASTELYRRIFGVNVLGTLLVTQAAAPHLVEGSAVVNFASIDAFVPSPGQLLYCASKAAVVALTRSLALELGPHVRVNALAPGWVDTAGNRASGRMEPRRGPCRSGGPPPRRRWPTLSDSSPARAVPSTSRARR
jgi:NAD(P)-dependent dehydrogenase (short-subunit alcohol dehydrogenase family)